MQRIVCRYRRESCASVFSYAEVRTFFQVAAAKAELPLAEDRRAVLLGPPLPPDATSEDERAVIELIEPREPSAVREGLNAYLPPGLTIDITWIAFPGSPDENPAHLDEAAYEVDWQDAPPLAELRERLRDFLAAHEIPLTRMREKKTQQLNARALVLNVHVLTAGTRQVRLLMTLGVGPRGTLRPEEVLQVLGYAPAAGTVCVHRVALHQSIWRQSTRLIQAAQWRRL